MSRSEAIWEDFNLEKNCVEVTDRTRVRLYFAQFSLALDCLERILEEHAGGGNAESRAVAHAMSRLRETFRILALRHFYTGTGSELKIDTTDSGFFHFSTLIELGADLKVRDGELAKFESHYALKQAMVDRIVKHGIHPHDLQRKMARRLYLENLDGSCIVDAFASGPLVQVSGKGEEPAYFWSFTTYDKALNRPFIYLIYFHYDGGKKALSKELACIAGLERAALKLAQGRLNLLGFSHKLDDELPHISPRIVRRLVLGPYWSPLFTENEGPFGALLEEHKARSPFALHWETETLFSDRETRVDKGLFRKGRLKQIFWIPRTSTALERGVSRLERFVLYPHWLGQQIEEAGLFKDHRRFVFDKEERVYGSD